MFRRVHIFWQYKLAVVRATDLRLADIQKEAVQHKDTLNAIWTVFDLDGSLELAPLAVLWGMLNLLIDSLEDVGFERGHVFGSVDGHSSP